MDFLLNHGSSYFRVLGHTPCADGARSSQTGPGGAGWELLTFLCCTFAGWSFFFASSLLMALVAWVLAWACAMPMRMSFNRRRA